MSLFYVYEGSCSAMHKPLLPWQLSCCHCCLVDVAAAANAAADATLHQLHTIIVLTANLSLAGALRSLVTMHSSQGFALLLHSLYLRARVFN